jgi:aryl-alcohol dehydrogenase-like predicted oxidoreductase
MKHKTLPGTDLDVSAICLGTAELGTVVDEPRAFRLLDVFLNHGGTFLDTASVYADWIPGERSMSEKTLGRWMKLRRNRQRVVVATKGAHPDLSSMDVSRLSPAEIVADLEASLRHLQVDVIDLYYLHRDDPVRPVGEILETLRDQVVAGKLRYFACSNWSAPRIQAAMDYAAAYGFQGFVADQMLWNLAVIDEGAIADKTTVMMNKPLRQLHVTSGMAAIPYSSQAGGLFQKMAAGRLDAMNPGVNRMYPLAENRQRFNRIQHLAAETGLSVTQLALGYLLSQPFVTVPVVGCKTMPHLHDTMNAADVLLDPMQVAYLERAEHPYEVT